MLREVCTTIARVPHTHAVESPDVLLPNGATWSMSSSSLTELTPPVDAMVSRLRNNPDEGLLTEHEARVLTTSTDRAAPEAQSLDHDLSRMLVPDLRQLEGEALWNEVAIQGASDLGGHFVSRARIVQALTEAQYHGEILEAMSGASSSFPARTYQRVTALDLSERMLEQYDHPDRRRIAACLERDREAILDRFRGSFDVVSVCFGWRYPQDIDGVLHLFRQLLKPGGRLSFIENPKAGYAWACHREFEPFSWVHQARECGFKMAQFRALDLDVGQKLPAPYYHCEAVAP